MAARRRTAVEACWLLGFIVAMVTNLCLILQLVTALGTIKLGVPVCICSPLPTLVTLSLIWLSPLVLDRLGHLAELLAH